MNISISVIIVTVVYSPLIALSLFRSKAIKEREKPWQYLVRAVLPVLAFLLMNVVAMVLEAIFNARRMPTYEANIPEVVANLLGAGTILLLSFDNIRCGSKINKVLGVVYVIACIFLVLMVITQT